MVDLDNFTDLWFELEILERLAFKGSFFPQWEVYIFKAHAKLSG